MSRTRPTTFQTALNQFSGVSHIVRENTIPEVCRIGTLFCRSGKQLGGLPEIQQQNAKFVIEKGSQVILALTQLRTVEKTKRKSSRTVFITSSVGHDASSLAKMYSRSRHTKRTPREFSTMAAPIVGTKLLSSDEECLNKDMQGASVNIGIRQRAKNLGTIVHMFSH